MIISDEEHISNKECGLKTFFAIKVIERKRLFGIGKKVKSTEIVARTRASNFMWALLHLRDVEYDQVVEAKLV